MPGRVASIDPSRLLKLAFDAGEHVAVVAVDGVAAAVAEDGVGGGVQGDQPIVARAAVDGVGLTVVGVDVIGAAFAVELIVARLPVDPVAGFSAEHAIVPAIAE